MKTFYLLETPDPNFPDIAQGLVVKHGTHAYPVLEYCDLTRKEQQEHEWARDHEGVEFLRYCGWAYPLEEFQVLADGTLKEAGWDGAASDSVWSGVLVKRLPCGSYRMGNYSQTSLGHARELGIRVQEVNNPVKSR